MKVIDNLKKELGYLHEEFGNDKATVCMNQYISGLIEEKNRLR